MNADSHAAPVSGGGHAPRADAGAAPAPARAKADGPRIALVLGAGGARGLAHLGVLDVIEERGLQVAAIAGSSMGALVGGIYAAGHFKAYRDWATRLQRSDVIRLVDIAFGHPGLIKGDRVIGALRDLVGDHLIEELPIPYTAVACDVEAQREVWLQKGKLFDAIRASMAIPMVFTPFRLNGRDLVDGGLLAPVPIAATRQALVDAVVAVDVNARPARVPAAESKPLAGATAPAPSAEAEGVTSRLVSIVGAWMERRSAAAAAEADAAPPGVLDLMSRSLDTMQAQLSRLQLALDPPDVLVNVSRDACLFYEYWRAEEMIALGRAAAEEALDAAGL